MIQEARPRLVGFHAAAALDSFPVFWVLLLGVFPVVSASWDLRFSPRVVLRLEIFIFLLGCFRRFGILRSGLGRLLREGWAAWFRFFLFFPCPIDPPTQCWARGGPFCLFAFCVRPADTPRSVLGPGWSLLFVCLLFFVRPAGTPRSVLGQGLGNRASKLRHGTVGVSCSFSLVVLPTPSSAPSRGAARVIW